MFSTAYFDQFGICRLCLVKENVNIPIFEEQRGSFLGINLKINTCLPIKVDPNDKLPKKICTDCYYKLESFYQFYNVSSDSEKQLFSWIEKISSSAEQEEDQIHLTNKVQPKAYIEDSDLDALFKALFDEPEGLLIHKEDQLVSEVSEQQDNSYNDNDWQKIDFTPCQDGVSDESVQLTPNVGKRTIIEKNLTVESDTVKKERKGKKPVKDRIKVSNNKKLTKSTFFYKKLNDEEYECLECHKKFKCLYKIKVHHRQIHLRKYTFECSFCDKTFTTKPAFKSHQKEEHGIEKDDIFSCDECDFTSSNKHNVAIHKIRKHSTSEGLFECDICKRKCKTKDDIRIHMSNHGEYENMCDVCGQFFISQHTLTRHKRIKHTYDYQCSICKTTLVSQVNLDNHIKEIHNPNDEFKCQECGQEFKRKRYLIRHQKRVHEKLEKAHVCTVCGKSFACKNTFRIHYLTHTKLKPYICNICGNAFSQRSSMMLHWKRQHPDACEPPPKVILTNVFENFNLMLGDNNYDDLDALLSNAL